MQKLKPGPKAVLEYLQAKDDKTATVDEIVEKLSHLYIKKENIERWVKQHSDLFVLKDNLLKIQESDSENEIADENYLKTDDLSPYVKRRSELVDHLQKLFVGPFFDEHEILGKKNAPMSFYLTGKLAPYGSTFEVINEDENDIKTNELNKRHFPL